MVRALLSSWVITLAAMLAILHAGAEAEAGSSTACNLYEGNDPSGTTITLTTGGTWYQWVSTSVGVTQGECTASSSTDRITVNRTGTYLVAFGTSFSGSTNEEIDANVHIDGSPQAACQLEQKLGTAGDVSRGAMVCLLFVRSGQYLDARFKSVNNSKSVSIKHASFSVVALP